MLQLSLGVQALRIGHGAVSSEGNADPLLHWTSVSNHRPTDLSRSKMHGNAKHQSRPLSANPTIYCWSFVREGSYEVELLKLHLKHELLSGCDSYAIFSNVTIDTLLGEHSPSRTSGGKVINGSSTFKMHNGKWGSSMNTPLFIDIWQAVFKAEEYKKYDWTAKVDLDTLLLPGRVKTLLQGRSPREEAEAIGQRTGERVLDGPLEILSNTAMEIYAEQAALDCEDNIPHGAISEDFYLDKCMKRMMVPRRRIENLVNHFGCSEEWFAAYHNLKEVDEMTQCLEKVKEAKVVVDE